MLVILLQKIQPGESFRSEKIEKKLHHSNFGQTIKLENPFNLGETIVFFKLYNHV